MPDVTLWHVDFLPEDVHDGDIHVAVEDVDVVEVDGPEAAAEVLLDSGMTQESGGGWWENPGDPAVLDYRTGERRETTGHVHGFDPDAEVEIARLVRDAR